MQTPSADVHNASGRRIWRRLTGHLGADGNAEANSAIKALAKQTDRFPMSM
jgi:hypothetical protein